MINDNPFSKFISIMQEEGSRSNPSFYLAKVTAPKEISLNGVTLYQEDLIKNADININVGDSVLLMPFEEKFIILCKVVAL